MTLQYKVFFYEYDFEMRLDRWLRRKYGEIFQGTIEKKVREHFIRVNDKKIKPQVKLINGDRISVEIHLHNKLETQNKFEIPNNNASDFSNLILQENEDFLVLNKPSGLDVQGGKNVKENIDLWLKSFSNQYRLVHRLDRDTSGILLIAKTLSSAVFFTKLFRERKIQKIYRAIVLGSLTPQGKISASLSEGAQGLMQIDEIYGKSAETAYKTIFYNSMENWSDIELEPHTGRKHQLRVHMAFAGNPIIGDKKYDIDGKTLYFLKNVKKKSYVFTRL
ncbi:MAG: RluA family pseudouridine synthase [Holosporales bacterium]|jgi:23S rRNA pseudouridine955/2504/2580 synthase|nr:RluA family pseudouridine synthase [Holosporales bacterium]